MDGRQLKEGKANEFGKSPATEGWEMNNLHSKHLELRWKMDQEWIDIDNFCILKTKRHIELAP